MKHLHPVCLFLLSCTCLLLCALAVSPVRAGIRPEAAALVNWKASLASADDSLGSWSLANSTSLCRWRHISCNLAGHIIELNLIDTSLNGTFDELDFSAFPHLENLFLYRNGLYGMFPAGISNLTSLVKLQVIDNPYLTGSIPRNIGQLKHLSSLKLANLGLGGTLPEEIGNLTILEELRLRSVTLTGSIPRTIGMLMKLRMLSLGNNDLTGSIPPEIANMTELLAMDFMYNYLEGHLPDSISHMINLQYLYLPGNQLGGHIVSKLGNSSLLHEVNLAENYFSGQFPPSICVRGALYSVAAGCNGFTSIHHHTFQNCTTLQYVDFTTNNIVSDLKDCIGEHPGQLKMMSFSRNQLHGTLLTNLNEPFLCNCTNLILLDLSSNALGGDLSKCFWDMPSLSLMDLSSNSFSGLVPFSRTCEDSLNHLHLADNHFKGTFPLALKECKNLITLDLGGNNFSGCIPEDIGNLVMLESIDLSRNQFSGEIPPSFASFKSISALNLSSNYLLGRIPMSNQLQTLVDLSIYSNNSGLCGFPLEDCINSSTSTQSESSQAEDREALWVYCFGAAGFTFGFWLYWGMFLFYSDNWRCTFYQYIDSMRRLVTKKIYGCMACFQANGNE